MNTNTPAGIDLTGNVFTFNAGVTTTNDGAVEITNAGLLTIAATGTMNLAGSFTQNGAGSVLTAGNITTTNDNISFLSPVTLTGNVALSTGLGIGSISFNNTLNGTADYAQSLGLTAGTGDILFNGAVGNSIPLGAVTINSANDLTANSTFTAKSITQTTGTGATHFVGAVDTTGAADTVGGVVNITTTGNIQFDSTITTTGGTTTAPNVGRAGGAVTLHSTTGAITVSGAINTSGSNGDDTGAATGKIGGAGGAVTITADNGNVNVGTITTNGGDGSGSAVGHTANGGAAGTVTITSTGNATTLNNNIYTVGGAKGAFGGTQGAGGTVTLNNPTLLNTNIAIDTGATAGNIVFNNTLNGAHNLDLTAGTGSITLGTTGSDDRLGVLTIHSVGNVVAAAIKAASIIQVAGTGTTTFNGALDTNTLAGINLTGNAFTINAGVTTTAGGPVTITNAGTLTIAALGDMSLDGAFTQNGLGAVSTAGDINTTNDTISFLKAVTLTGSVALNTVSLAGTGADITFSSTLTGAQNLTLTAGTADILFNGAVGAVKLGDVLINSAHDLTANSTFSAKSITHTAGTGAVHFVGAVNTVGAANAPGGLINIVTTGNINFDSTIATTGGAAGLGMPGQNGGNIILNSTNGLITVGSTITTSGSNGRGNAVTAQPGGNAGTVTITADNGNVTVAAITTSGGAGNGGTSGLTADGGNAGSVTITSTGNITTLNGNITSVGGLGANSGTQGLGANVTLNSPVILGAGIIINTTGSTAGNITFNDILNGTIPGAQSLGLTAGTGNIIFAGAVGGTTRLGAITINSAVNVTTNAVNAASITQAAGTGNTTFNGALNTNTATGINLTGNVFIFNAGVTTTSNGILEVTNSGLLTIASAADMNLDGSFTQNGTGSVSLAGDITTSNDAISFLRAVTLTGPVVLNTGTGLGNITFSSTLDGTYDLDLATGTGSITLGATGATNRLGALTINSAANVTAAAINAASITQLAGTGTTTFNGAVDITAGLDITNSTFTQNALAAINAHSSAISITADTIALNADISGSSTITLQPITLNRSIGIGDGASGSFNLTSTEIGYLHDGFSQIIIGRPDGTGSIDIHSITFTDPITIRSPGLAGNITVNGIFSTALANAAINFIAGSGNTGSFTQTAGAGTTISSGSGPITITADSIALNTSPNTIIGIGAITLQPSSVDRPIVIAAAGAAGDFALSTQEIAALQNGFSLIAIGRDDGAGGVNIAGPVTFYDPVVIKSPSGGSISVNGQITGLDNASIEFDGTGSTMTLNANIVTSGTPIIINDSVILGTPATILLDTTNGGGSAAGADISITGTVNDDANPSSLVLTAGTIGDVTIGGVIGGTTAIAGDLTVTGHNISLNDIGALVLGTPNVGVVGNVSAVSSGITPFIVFTGTNYYTSGSQTYNAGAVNTIQLAGGAAGSTVRMGTQGSAVSFTGKIDMNDRIFGIDTTFDGVVPAGNNITFNQSINDVGGTGANSALWLNGGTTGNVNLAGAVGDTNPLESLTVANAALLDLNNVATTGSQSYTAANIHLNGVSYTGSISGGSSISFTGAVNLNAAAPISVTTGLGAGDNITFSSSIDGAQDLTLSAGLGDVEIDGAVGAGIALSNLTASGNNVTLNAVSTTGSQGYTGTASVTLYGDLLSAVTGAITINGAATIGNNILIQTAGALAGDDITFTSTINGSRTLTLNSGNSGNIDLQGIIGGVAPLTGLTITNAHNVDAGKVTLLGDLFQSAGTGYTHFTGAIATTGASNSPGGSVNISTSGAINFDSTINTKGGTATAGNLGQNGGNVTLHSTGGLIEVTGAINTSGSAGNANAANKSRDGGIGGTVIVTADAGDITVGVITTNGGAGDRAGTFSADGGAAGAVNITSTGHTTTLNNDIKAKGGAKAGPVGTPGAGGNVTFNSPVLLGAGIGINTGATAGNIIFDNTLNGAHTLDLTAGTGNITFTGAVGGSTKVGAITINNAANVDAGAGVTAKSITQDAGTGHTHFIGAVNTSGAANTAGGVVNITTAGDIEFDSTINTSGGSTTAGNAGKAGGAVTLSSAGGDVILGGAVTTSGSNATGGIRNGGNAGAINITSGAGKLIKLYGDITAIGGNQSGAGIHGAGGNVTLHSPTVLYNAININTGTITLGTVTFDNTLDSATGIEGFTITGNAVFDGVVGATPLSSLHVTGTTAINATGITTSGTQAYDGAVTLGTSPINLSAGGTGVTFDSTLDGASDLTVTGKAVFNGIVGATSLNSLHVIDTSTINTTTITTTGLQTYNDAVTLGAHATLTGTDISFNDTLDGNFDLTINGSGATTFGGVVGGLAPLASITTNAAGTTNIGADMSTQGGTMTFNDPVVLLASVTLTDTGATGITFANTVDGPFNLTLASNGATNFNQAVGSTNPIGTGTGAALTVNSLGATNFNSTLETASGITQANGAGLLTFKQDVTIGAGNTANTFNANVTLDGLTFTSAKDITFGNATSDQLNLTTAAAIIDTSVAGANVTFNSKIDGNQDLTVNSGTGTTTFNGIVGGVTPLASITTDASGTTNINSGSITTVGSQTYNDDVILVSDTTLNGVGITFAKTLVSDGTNRSLLVNDSGATNFNGAVGGALGLALSSLTTDAPGTTNINGGSVTTTGVQTYNDAVTLGLDTVLTGTTLTFNSTIAGATHDLTLAGSINNILNNTLTGVADLVVNGPLGINTTTITTTGLQTYNDAVTLGAHATLTGTDISFNDTLDGNFDLTINGSGATTFGGVVGGTNPLASLTTVLGGSTQINGGSVTTGGDQNYNDPVTLGADATLTSNLGTVKAHDTITTNNHNLTINTATGLTIYNDIAAGSGTVTLNPTAGGVSQSAATTLTADKLLLLGSGTFNLNQTTNNVNILAANITGGTLTYQDADALTVGSVSGTNGITTGGNDVTLNTGNTLTIANDIDAGTGTVTLNPTAGGAAETTGKILAANLLLTGGGTFTLNNAFNNVNILAVNITGGTLTYQDADALIIGSVSGTDGITTGGNDVTIKSGALTLDKGITATGATITLDVAGITQSSPVIADSLLLKGTGTFTLDNASNNVNTIAADVTGSLTYKDADSLTVGTVVGVNGLTAANLGSIITIKALNGFLTISKAISAIGGSILLGTAEAAEFTPADLSLGADLTALTSVTLNSADAITRTAGTITADSLDLTADAGIGTLASPLDSKVNTLNASNATSGDIALTNNGDLIAASVVNPNGNIYLIVNSNLTVGSIQGLTVNLTANTGSILDDTDEANKITADTVNLTALNDIGANTLTGDIDIDSAEINATAGGDIYIESLGPTTFNVITGNGINLLSNGTSFLNTITGIGPMIIRVASGDVWFTGTVTSTTSGADISSDNGSIFAIGAGPHLITNADTFLSAPNGTITAIRSHLNITLNSGFLVLNIGGSVGGVSGKLDGTVPSLSNILLQPSSFPSPLYPPGRVYWNGIFIWPSASTFANSQSNTLLGRYSIPVNFQAFLINTADTRLALFYQPLTELDASAFDAAMGIGADAYEFMDGSLNLLGHEGLLPVFEDIKKKNKGKK